MTTTIHMNDGTILTGTKKMQEGEILSLVDPQGVPLKIDLREAFRVWTLLDDLADRRIYKNELTGARIERYRQCSRCGKDDTTHNIQDVRQCALHLLTPLQGDSRYDEIAKALHALPEGRVRYDWEPTSPGSSTWAAVTDTYPPRRVGWVEHRRGLWDCGGLVGAYDIHAAVNTLANAKALVGHFLRSQNLLHTTEK